MNEPAQKMFEYLAGVGGAMQDFVNGSPHPQEVADELMPEDLIELMQDDPDGATLAQVLTRVERSCKFMAEFAIGLRRAIARRHAALTGLVPDGKPPLEKPE